MGLSHSGMELRRGAERAREATHLVSVVGTDKYQVPASGRGGPLRREQGSLGHEPHGRCRMAWQIPAAQDSYPSGLGSCKARPVSGQVAAWTGVWSAVGDLYCEIVRTLSTNWNLKFQRGEAEGPTPE